jgi:hypothetical protein
MRLKTVALISLLAGVSYANGNGEDDDAVADQCQRECVEDCLVNSTGAETAQKCEKACVRTCRQDITAPQRTFKGRVTATPVQCPSITTTTTTTLDTTSATSSFQLPCASSAGSTSCAAISGTVANRLFFGGAVTLWVICPAGTPFLSPGESTTTTRLATTTSDATTGAFSFRPPVTGVCSGQTGCYGLIAVTPAPSANPTPDPNWNSCTNGISCPGP